MRALRWATPVVLVVLLVLVLTRWLSPGEAIVALVVVEAAMALAALLQGATGVWSYRSARRGGADREAAFEAAARTALPGPIATAVLHEARLVHSLLLWVGGRQHGVPPGAVAIPYGRDGRAVGIALLVVGFVELVVVELVIPWPTVRLVLLLLGVYGALIVLGFIAGPIVRPHVLTEDSLRLRASTWADVTLPLDMIIRTSQRRGGADGTFAFTGATLVLAVDNQTQLHLELDGSRTFRQGRQSGSADSVRFSADDPAAAANAITAAVRASRSST